MSHLCHFRLCHWFCLDSPRLVKYSCCQENSPLRATNVLFSTFFCFAFWNANMNSIKCHLTFKTSQGMTRNERKSCIFAFVQKNALFCCRLEQKPSKIAQLKSPWMKKKMEIRIKINWMIENYVVLGSICTRIKFFFVLKFFISLDI